MSKLNVDQRTIFDLFSDRKADFLIPDYQRPYAWEEKECQTLWDDIQKFAFPDDDSSKFDSENDEYYLGPIVTFKNGGKMEIIDGQQRLTTLMLLLRAFYEKFGKMKDPKALKTRENLSKCIWKIDEYQQPIMDCLKINSEVATDKDKDEFLTILELGEANEKMKSNYAMNYRFFQQKIKDFQDSYSDYLSLFPTRILNNCILLPIEADNQNTALRIFSTLNDRGMPLSDADIFKAQFYKFYSQRNEKDIFIKRWRDLEDCCKANFHPITGTPMDELFTRYMYFQRALKGLKSSTTEALRKFYERDSYSLLNNEQTLTDLETLASFWNDVNNQDKIRFSTKVLRRLFVLNYAPNGMWAYITSVYFMHNRDKDGNLDDERFYSFLNKITGFILAYAVTNPGVNALRTPVYAEMVNIVENREVTFSDWAFDPDKLKSMLDNYVFSNNRAITKSMLTWWAFNFETQPLLDIDTVLEIEHIYPRNRQENHHGLHNSKNLEVLGNKSLLEKKVNIRVTDYGFDVKSKYYKGELLDKQQNKKEGTKIIELVSLANTHTDFVESDIELRNNNIFDGFIKYLQQNNLIKS